YEEVSCERIVSGTDWKYDFSPVLFYCIFGGEDYDARREQKGWNMFCFKEQDWRPVVIQEAPTGVLRPQIA
ncbi:alpha-L-rhamnosidase N-terminal domain-containing protein, partial [Phocaeicola vulgatus]|uniref:alpha-L-rhamnosidase N-terminal domain-containing protein n=1 Tax=Phocaeicola vulgatus TaxID=821 RepID=UPI00210B41C6